MIRRSSLQAAYAMAGHVRPRRSGPPLAPACVAVGAPRGNRQARWNGGDIALCAGGGAVARCGMPEPDVNSVRALVGAHELVDRGQCVRARHCDRSDDRPFVILRRPCLHFLGRGHRVCVWLPACSHASPGGVNSKKPPHLRGKYLKPPVFGKIAKIYRFCANSSQCALIVELSRIDTF
jgi:hypothetical protein